MHFHCRRLKYIFIIGQWLFLPKMHVSLTDVFECPRLSTIAPLPLGSFRQPLRYRRCPILASSSQESGSMVCAKRPQRPANNSSSAKCLSDYINSVTRVWRTFDAQKAIIDCYTLFGMWITEWNSLKPLHSSSWTLLSAWFISYITFFGQNILHNEHSSSTYMSSVQKNVFFNFWK